MLILEKNKVIKYETNISSNDSPRSKKIVFSLNGNVLFNDALNTFFYLNKIKILLYTSSEVPDSVILKWQKYVISQPNWNIV